MKIIISSLSLFFSFGLFAQIDLVKNDDSQVVLDLSIEKPLISSVTIQGKSYTKAEVTDALLETKPGYPDVPFYRIHLKAPLGKKVGLEILKLQYEKISLTKPLSPQLRIPLHDGVVRFVPVNAEAYQKAYGEKAIEIEEIGFAGNEKIIALKWSPIRYDASSNEIHWTKSLKVKVGFEVDSSLSNEKTKRGSSGIASLFVLNSDSSSTHASTKKIDLVIAHESYKTALSTFLDWKRQAGHEVREYYVQGKKNSEIKALISEEYNKANPPTSTVLVGSIDQIPSWQGSNDNTWTDFNYQCLDTDAIPDLSLGRIPAQNATELTGFLEKVVARENASRNYNDVLLTAGQDTSLGCPANVSKVGDKFLTDGNPAKITKKYRTEVSSQAVWDAYNNNPNLIVYDGHGNRQGMSEIPLTISNLDKLNNTSFPILLDIACLNANWTSAGASSRNFAEKILLDPKRGLAGILGSGGSGMGHVFFQTIGQIMATARKQMESDSLKNEIGRVVWASKVKGNSEDRTFWNYYGDPNSSVWESTIKN